MPTPLNMLMLASSPSDAELLAHRLGTEGFAAVWQRVATEADYTAALTSPLEVVLADWCSPQLSVARALELVRESGLCLVFIVLCEPEDEERASALLFEGATDCVRKDRFARLVWAVRRGLAETKLRADHQRVEQALRQSEARHEAMLTHSRSIVFMKDQEGRYLLVNPQFEKSLGISSAQVVGKRDEDVFPPEQAEQFTAHDHQVFTSGQALEFEEVIRWHTGDRTFMVSKFPVRDGNGAKFGVAGIAMEVTEHRRAEANLRQSEELYRSVVEGAMEGLAIHQNGIIRFANQAAARLAGYDRAADLIGRNIWETFVAPEARAELQARCAASLRGETLPMHTGWQGIRKDGSRVWVQSSVTLIHWQGQPAFLGYFSDITERKQAEESLRASEERFSKAFHGSPLPVSIVTVNEGRYIDANASLAAMIGRTRDEIIGQTAFGLGIWPDPAKRAELVRLVSEFSIVRNFEAQLEVKDGELRDVLISAESIQLGGERCMIVVTQDITEQRRLEEQFRHAQKMEAVGRLAGGLAHDFNNLLTIIQGHAALLNDSGGAETIQEAADQILLAAQRAASLTRQLLMFSHRQVMQPRDLDLNEVIDRTGKMLRRLLGEDIDLRFNRAPSLPLVRADSGMIEQVLLNLAVNSRDAMPKGGQLTIATSARVLDETAARKMGVTHSGLMVCLTVNDTGCGIPEENLNRIFEPFFTTKGIGKGTGLGLATAYGIVKQHKGWIRVASEVGRGSTFQIYLPAVSKATAAAGTAPAETPVRGGDEGILLVEDEGALRVLVRNLLERYGYRVFEAASGKSALAIWQEQKQSIDLVLTDVVMPGGMTGRQIVEQIQRDNRAVKIIYSSGYSADVIAKDLVLEEGIRFLQKPYDPRILAETVRRCLDGN